MDIEKYVQDRCLSHAGIKGMKWGFNFGKRNGKRTADEMMEATIEAFGWGSPYFVERTENGKRYTEEHLYETVKSMGLFSGTDRTRVEEYNIGITSSKGGLNSTHKVYTHYRDIGLIEQAVKKAKKFISDLFDKEKKRVKARQVVSKTGAVGAVSAVKTGKKLKSKYR